MLQIILPKLPRMAYFNYLLFFVTLLHKFLVKGKVKSINFKGLRFLGYLLPSSHTLPLTTVKRARLSRSSIRNILLALDIGDGCRQIGYRMVQHIM